MNRKPALSLLLMAAIGLIPSPANAKKHSDLAAVFGTAKTVFVESKDGDITDIHLNPGDRGAILDTQDGVKDWGRYTLSRSRYDADLILVVHKGRLRREQPNPATGLGGPPGARSPIGHPPAQGPTGAAQDPDNPNSADGLMVEKDQLQVFILQPDGKLKGPIWHDELERGLDAPMTILLKRLKADVQKAYPTQTPPSP